MKISYTCHTVQRVLSAQLVIFFSFFCSSSANRQVQQRKACCQATTQSVWLKLWFPIYHLRDWCGFFSSDALQSSWDGLMHSSSTLVKWIFAAKWNIWFTWSRATSSSTNLTLGYTCRMSFGTLVQTCAHLTRLIWRYLEEFVSLPSHLTLQHLLDTYHPIPLEGTRQIKGCTKPYSCLLFWMTTAALADVLQPDFIIMINSNLSEKLLCSGWLFERGMEEEEIECMRLCGSAFSGSQMMSSVKPT